MSMGLILYNIRTHNYVSSNFYSEQVKRLAKIQDEYGAVKEAAKREARAKQIQQSEYASP